jgi:hypothetical protein
MTGVSRIDRPAVRPVGIVSTRDPITTVASQPLGPLVDDPSHLADGPFDPTRCDHVHGHRHADPVLDERGQVVPLVAGGAQLGASPVFHPDRQPVHPVRARQHALEMWRESGCLQDQFLDLGREEVHSAQDDQVVAAPGDLLDPPHRPGGARQQPGEIAGAVTHDRHCLLGQRREDQLPVVAVRHHRTGDRVDDLRIEAVLPEVQGSLALDALDPDPWADHLGQAVDVDGVDVHPPLHLAAHLVGPRLRPEDAKLQRGLGRIDALPLDLVDDGQHVRRGDHVEVRLEVVDQSDLPFGHPAGHGNDGAAELLGTVVGPRAAG